ncbi:DUF4297 domain-containing protein [Noviherbaspirillum cavernae]|uniref:DUF4297 domain-containing protein n=1 Tax=Noviherbaspirillum cavernae TaxID=2320862 RepID=A0A418WYL8_9BURK|nr:dsDNA nuclease domain-containing protein [Noviherbaspirillum cavernae]RJG05358.1 DUF4297 domain-containing protein [Noviherbaspirillum cavernae]
MGRRLHKALSADILVDIPLRDATPTNDMGDDVQRAFRYQNAYGVILLAAAASGTANYRAIWCEHHEDLLGERNDDLFDAYQVKTKAPHTGLWKSSDEQFIKSLRRFCELERKHGPKVNKYCFVSNCPVYIPTKAAKKEDAIQSSPVKFIDAVQSASTESSITMPHQTTFGKLKKSFGGDGVLLFQVLKRTYFILGPSLNDYEDVVLTRYVAVIPKCSGLNIESLAGIRDELIQKVWEASSSASSGPEKHLSPVGADGKTPFELRSKRVSLEDVEFITSERSHHVFRYSPDSLEVSYSDAKSKMGVLRRKMEVGGIGLHFDYVETKAIAALERLFEQANVRPEQSLETLGHLEKVVLSECHEANIEVATQPENERGIKMLGNVVTRFRTLAKEELHKVDGQPYEVLVGLAGLLSGECKVWWGIPLPKETPDES